MKHFAMAFALCSLGATLTGCGGGSGGGQGLPTAVTVSANQTSLLQGQSVLIAAVVMHVHSGSTAVSWSLSGANCPNNCGSLSNTTAANTEAYTAPKTVNANFSVTVTATSVADSTAMGSVTLNILAEPCPSGNEAVLNGQYAFMAQGTISPDVILALAGSFTANGAGGITGGLEDLNRTFGGPEPPGLTILSQGSSYSVGADNRGCLTLVNSNNETTTYRFALGSISAGVATKGRLIEFDDSSGAGTRAEGILRRQDPASFSGNSFVGNYVFALSGQDPSTGHPRVALAGVVNAKAGMFQNGEMDINDGGTISSAMTNGGGFSVAASGRGTFTLHNALNGVFLGVLYMVSSQEIIVTTQPVSSPLVTGEFFQQAQSSFSSSALNGKIVAYTSGFGSGSAGPDVSIGLFALDGAGNYTGTLDSNVAGSFMPSQSLSGAYSVGANGRTTTGNNTPIFYLTNTNTGVILGLGPTVESGYFGPQATGLLSNATISGMFYAGTESADAASRPITSGAVSFDGAGSYTGTEDQSTPSGLNSNQALSNTYSFSATSVPTGRGTLDSPGNTVAYIVSPSKLVFFDKTAMKPSLTVVEK